MSQQTNKVKKKARHKAYISRCKAKVREAIAAKAKK